MNTATLGIRNAFRSPIRSTSIIVILGLSIGLCLVMLIAHEAVGQKIDDVKSSIGNTITISPAGFSGFSQVNNALTVDQLNNVKALPHVTELTENLTDRLTTIGAAQPSFGRFSDSTNSNAQTSLTSPITINSIVRSGQGFRAFINGGGSLPTNFSLPIPIIGTTNPTTLDNNDAALKGGKMIDGAKDSNDALVSTTMASKNSLGVGSAFTAYGQQLTVVGIFDTGNQAANSTIVVSLPALQRLTGQSGTVTSAIAAVDSLDNLSSATTGVKNTLGSSADVQSAQDQADAAVQPLQNVASISFISLIGAVVAGGIIILLTMVMIVRERRREIGILKAIGASNARVIFQFVSEALTLTIAGALVGVLIGIAGGAPATNALVAGSTVTAASNPAAASGLSGRGGGFAQRFGARPLTGGFLQRGGIGLANTTRNIATNIGWNILVYGLAAALIIAAVGSALAGWMIARVKPSEVMRAE